jgi:hypothetical protein
MQINILSENATNSRRQFPKCYLNAKVWLWNHGVTKVLDMNIFKSVKDTIKRSLGRSIKIPDIDPQLLVDLKSEFYTDCMSLSDFCKKDYYRLWGFISS